MARPPLRPDRLADLPPVPGVHVERRAQLRPQVHHAPDHPEHGLHQHAGAAPHGAAVRLRGRLCRGVGGAGGQADVAAAVHRGAAGAACGGVRGAVAAKLGYKGQRRRVLLLRPPLNRRHVPHRPGRERLDA